MAMCNELVPGASHTAAPDGHKQRKNGFPHLRQLSSRTWDRGMKDVAVAEMTAWILKLRSKGLCEATAHLRS